MIDELAHTNAPGMRNEKRYEDIEEALAAGIDVISTVNVQHLESLNDAVFELTGVRVRETFPDRVLDEADEVVLVDLAPEALQGRLAAGKVYPQDRAEVALQNFFKLDNLSALRELALREVAEDVEARRHPTVLDTLSQQAVERARARAHRAAAEVPAHPAPRLAVRSAPRQRDRRALGAAERPPAHRRGSDPDRRVATARERPRGRTCSKRTGDDLVATVRRVARERGSTYIFVGTPDESRRREIFGGSLLSRMVRELPGIDIRVVASRADRARLE